MVVNKLMYGCGALATYQHECDGLEVMQNEICRWLCDVGNVRYELIRGAQDEVRLKREGIKKNGVMGVKSAV